MPGGTMATELRLELIEPLEQRVEQFKSDPEKMREVNDFLNELLEKAKIEAEIRRKSKKYDAFNIQNGSRRIGAWSSRARTSARTFANRLFTAICNCTNQVRNATTAAINRNP